MSGVATPRLITRWASQNTRLPPAFAPGAAALDGRDLPELLADIAHIAGTVPFHDLEQGEHGDWRGVLGADNSFLLALLASADLDGSVARLEALLERARAASFDEADDLLGELIDALLRFADTLDQWMSPAALGGTLDPQPIHRVVETAIEQVLAPQLEALFDQIAIAEQAGWTDQFRRHRGRWQAFDQRWRRAVLDREIRGIAAAVERAWADRLLRRMVDAAEAFIREGRAIRARAARQFDASLHAADHSAHPALAIAFAQIFREAQARLDAIPERLIDHYQQAILRATPDGARPDRLVLTLTPRPGLRPTLVRGTLIPVGKDEQGHGIAFAMDADLTVTGAILREVRLWTPSDAGTSLLALAAGEDGTLGDLTQAGARAVPAAIFSTPQLVLPGGTRRLRLVLGCDAAVDTGSLGVFVSIATGWVAVPDATWSSSASELVLTATLPPDFPALAPYPGEESVAAPAIKITLERGSSPAVTLTHASLSVAAKDAPGLSVRTPSGLASLSAAAPFGTPPYSGGWLRLDHPAFSGVPLDRLVLRFDWAGLPAGDGGFASYYAGYVVDAAGRLVDRPPFDNAAFLVTLSAPVPGWDAGRRMTLFAPAALDVAPPCPAVPPPDLFADAFDPAAPLMPEDGPIAPQSWLAAAANSGETTSDAPDHITLTLAGPDDAFGHSLYAANVQYAVEAIAHGQETAPRRPGLIRRVLRAAVRFPGRVIARLSGTAPSAHVDRVSPTITLLPNVPFQPLLSGIHLDYALTAQAIALHHAAPTQPIVRQAIAGAPLFPALPEHATLDLGWTGAKPGDTLSMLVQLGAGVVASSRPRFAYCTLAGWAPLPPTAILDDGTAGLSMTGILRLVLPTDAVDDDDRQWLRIMFEGGATPPILAIAADALSATRRLGGHETTLSPIPAGTVVKIAGVPAIARALQPLDSAGGRGPEPAASLRSRVAEQVRHRGRALTAWDMEHLLLAEFPAIARVRVFPARTENGGTVTAVLVPAAAGAVLPDPVSPRPSAALRSAAAARLQAIASPFAQVEILDPVYAAVDVTATLVMADGDTSAVQQALASLLSPWPEPWLDLDDHAGEDRVRAAIVAFLLHRPEVVRIERLSVTLEDVPGAKYRVPTLGELAITGVAAQVAGAW